MRWAFWRREAAGSQKGEQAAARPGPKEWTKLPPIQRTVGPPTETGGGTGFVQGLAGSHPPELAVQQLGHEVSDSAPSGLIVGPPPATTYVPATELVTARMPRPRQGSGWLQRWLGGSSAEPAPAAAEPVSAEPMATKPIYEPSESAGEAETGTEAPRGDLAKAPASLPAPGERRRLEVISAPLVKPVPLTVARLEASAPAPRTVASATGDPVSRAASPAADNVPPLPAVPELRGEAPSAPDQSSTRLTLGQSRRLGLGPPISRAPVQPTVQRMAEGSHETPSDADADAAVQAGAAMERLTTPAEAPISESGPAQRVPGPVASVPRPELGLGLFVQRRSSRTEAGPPADLRAAASRPAEAKDYPSETAIPADAALPAQPREPAATPAPADSEPGAPAPALPLQRLATPAASRVLPVVDEPRPAQTPWTPATEPPSQRPLVGRRSPTMVSRPAPGGATSTAPSFRTSTAPFVQRTADSDAFPAGAPGQAWSAPGELPAPARQLLPALPLEDLAGAEHAEGPSDSPLLALQPMVTANRQPEAPLSLVRPAWAAPPPPAAIAPTLPVLQRQPEMALPAAFGSGLAPLAEELPALQRQDEAAAAQPAAAPASGSGGAAGGHSEKDLDDLARQLYNRFRVHFRSELLIDRERAGMLVDRR